MTDRSRTPSTLDRRVFPSPVGHEVLPVRPDALHAPAEALALVEIVVVRFIRPGTSRIALPTGDGPRVIELDRDDDDARRAAAVREVAREHPAAWLLPLEVDDELSADAFARLASVVVRAPSTDIAYGDHVDVSEGRHEPRCKPAWSPHMQWTTDYVAAPCMLRASLVAKLPDEQVAGGLHALVIAAAQRARRIAHVPDALCWRRRPAARREDPAALRAAIALSVDEARTSIHLTEHPTLADRWVVDLRPVDRPLVSTVVPFRDKPELLEVCARGVLEQTEYDRVELVLVDNASTEAGTRELLERLARDPRVKVVRDESTPFNYSAVNNRAVAASTGEFVLLLNNDIEVVDPGWLDSMVGYAMQDDVGEVGAYLTYPGGLVQHAGVAIGIGGYASHPLARLEPGASTPWGNSQLQRDLLATTAACAMVRRDRWDAVGGFDERFQLCGSDVVLGLAQHTRGLWNVYLPHVHLVHHESVSRGSEIPAGDFIASRAAYDPWVAGADPFYHPSLTLDGDDCTLAVHRSHADVPPVRWSRPLRQDAPT